MSPTMNQSQSPMGLNQIQDFALNFVYNFCSIVTMPVEMALRPQYGSRYFQPMVMFLSAMLMVFLPMFFTFAAAVGQMIPFARFRGPVGLIGMWGISRLFFLGALIHGVRVWRLMLTPAREIHSYYEGPALPFFRRLPWSFWVTRIIAEPAFLRAFDLLAQLLHSGAWRGSLSRSVRHYARDEELHRLVQILVDHSGHFRPAQFRSDHAASDREPRHARRDGTGASGELSQESP